MIRTIRRYLTRRALRRLEDEHARLKAIAASNRKGAQVAAHKLRAVMSARLTLEVGR